MSGEAETSSGGLLSVKQLGTGSAIPELVPT